jgi:polysaccharide biosynthesis/export protein
MKTTEQKQGMMAALVTLVASQGAQATGPIPGISVVPLVLEAQARRIQEARPLLIPSPGEPRTAVAVSAAPQSPTRYKVRAGDSLEVKVMGRPELTQAVTVAPDGTIIYPYVGEISIAGDTLMQITNKLKLGLKSQLEKPQVLVSVLKRQMGEVSILGPVKEPGKKELGDDWRLLNLLAAAGGMTAERPEFVTMRLVRKGGQSTITIDPIQLFASSDPQRNILLEDGDLLVIQERDKSETMVNVVGEVGKPGHVLCPRDGSPVAALVAAGGATSKASLSKATIRRGSGGTPIAVDLSNPDKLPFNLQLGPGDTLTIPAGISQIFVSGGGVLKPGAIELGDKAQPTIYWAIQQAGGVQQDADLKHASITRLAPNGAPITEEVDLEKILKNRNAQGKSAEEAAKLNRMLMPGDILDIPVKGGKRRGFNLGLNEAMMGLSTYLMIRQIR